MSPEYSRSAREEHSPSVAGAGSRLASAMLQATNGIVGSLNEHDTLLTETSDPISWREQMPGTPAYTCCTLRRAPSGGLEGAGGHCPALEHLVRHHLSWHTAQYSTPGRWLAATRINGHNLHRCISTFLGCLLSMVLYAN
jgi:hypothetical protein